MKFSQIQFFFFLLFAQNQWSQDLVIKIDSLYNSDYTKLSEKFRLLSRDTIEYRKYAEAYLYKAKLNNDIIKQSNGYFLHALISKELTAIKYADSIIELTKKIEDFDYPAKAHILKARNLGIKEQYAKSLEELLKANKYSIKNNNLNQKNKVNYFIGVLKQSIGEYEEALVRFKSTEKYYKEKFNKYKTHKYDYLKSLYAISSSYNNLKKHDSAYITVNKGMKLSLKSSDSIFYGYFLLSSGITHYFKKDYQSSLDSLYKFKRKYKSRIRDGNIIIADLFIGRSYYELNDIEKSIYFLEKVDSITPLKVRSSYELLLKLYKKKGDIEKQIEYIDKILNIDSLINQDSNYLYKNIEKEYSTPNLILEKEEIISSLRGKTKNSQIWIFILLVFIVFITTVLLYNYRKKIAYKKRFIELYNSKNIDLKSRENVQKDKTEDLGIPENVIKEILEKIEQFEKNKEFTNSGLTIAELSKKFQTNTRYLSKIINQYKNKSFSNYINDLRIEFVINELKNNNNKFRKYTIKAISNDIGFKSTQVFSKLFYKKTGIYPSFFLKELEKERK